MSVESELKNQWVERFIRHGVHQTLSNSAANLDAADERAKDDLEALLSSQRVRALFDRTAQLLVSSEPFLVSISTLDNLNAQAVNAVSEIVAFVSNGNIGHLANANNHADSLAAIGAALHVPSPDAEIMVKTANALRVAVDKHLSSIRIDATKVRDDVEALHAKFVAIEADISAQKARLDTAISQFQQQAATAEAERTTQFGQSELNRQTTAATSEELRRAANTSAVIELKTTFDALVLKADTSFTALQVAHEKSIGERTTAFSASMEAQRKVFKQLSVELKASAETVVKGIEEERQKAEKIVHVVGNTGMVGGYQKTANEERDAASVWNIITVGAMAVLVAGAIYLVVETPSEFSWSYLASRIFVATAVAILATYAGRQAALHRDEARSLRRMELEIASIDPYLALLPEADRNAVKKSLADRMFAQPARSKDAERISPTGSAADPLKVGYDTGKVALEALIKIAGKH